MKNILLLLKVQLKTAFKLRDQKPGMVALTVVSYAVLGGLFVFMGIGSTLFLGSAFLDKELSREFLTIFWSTSQIIVLIFGTIMMLSTLYYSRDNELLSSLPVTPQQIFFAKFFFVYLNELAISTVFVLTIGITFGVMAGAGVGFFFGLLAVALLLPLLPLLLSALISIPLIYLLTFFKNKGIWTSILLIVVFVLVFVLYFQFVNVVATTMPSEDNPVITIPDEYVPGIQNAARILLPVYALAGLVLGLPNAWLNLLIVAGSFLVLFALGYLLSLTAFSRGVKAQFEDNKRVVTAGPKEQKQYGAAVSLMRADFKIILRTPLLAFYSLFQIVFCPIIIFLMSGNLSGGADVPDATQQIIGTVMTMTALFLILLISGSTNYTALSAFSREGQNLYQLKALPLTTGQIVSAKTLLARIFTGVAVLVGGVAAAIAFRLAWFDALGMVLFLLVYSDGFTHYLVYLDLKRPKLDWDNIGAALRNDTRVLFGMLISFASVVAVVGLYCIAEFVLIIALGLDETAVMGIFWCLMIAAACGLGVAFRSTLKKNSDRLFGQLE